MFPEILKRLRINKKRSQQEMADFLGITRQGYGKYENGGSQPSFEMLQKIADYFEVSTDQLFGRDDKQETKNAVGFSSKESRLTAEEEFEAFANDPELERWYKELPKNKEEDLQSLKQMWDIIKKNKK